jgi:hypothetical protein
VEGPCQEGVLAGRTSVKEDLHPPLVFAVIP